MNMNVVQTECEDNPSDVYNSIFNDVVAKMAKDLIPEDQQTWYAEYIFKVKPSTFSMYLSGKRSFPVWLLVAMARKFKGRASNLVEAVNHAIETGAGHKCLDQRSMEKLFVLALKEEGLFNSALASAIMGHFQSVEEIDQLDRKFNALSHMTTTMRERLAETRERLVEQGQRRVS